jgi:hypothetical protein
MRKLITISLFAGIATIAVSAQSTPAPTDDMQPIVVARRGADNPPGDMRRGRGADDPAGHNRRGRGMDDGATPAGSTSGGATPGRNGADDPPGDDRGRGRGRGGDDGPGHA